MSHDVLFEKARQLGSLHIKENYMLLGEKNVSYDISLCDPVTKERLHADSPHQIRGGTYAMGGTTELWLSITFNYAKFYYEHFPEEKGLCWLQDKLAVDTIPVIQKVIDLLKDDVDDDYWKSTEGNAKRALYGLLSFAKMRPDGIWEVSA